MENEINSHLSETRRKQVDRLHREALIIDALQYSTPDSAYLDLLQTAGINAVHYTVAANSFFQGNLLDDDFVTTCKKIGRWYSLLEEFGDRIELATSVPEMERINRDGKIAIFFGF